MQIDDGGGGCCHQRKFPAVKLALVLIVLLFPLYIAVSETSDGSPLYGNYSGTGSEFDPYRGILNYNAYSIDGLSEDIDGCYVLVGSEFINEGGNRTQPPSGDDYSVTEGFGLEMTYNGREFFLTGTVSKSGTVEITRTISSTTEVISTFYIVESSYPLTATSGSGTEEDPYGGILTSTVELEDSNYIPSEIWVYKGTEVNIPVHIQGDSLIVPDPSWIVVDDGFGITSSSSESSTADMYVIGTISATGDCTIGQTDSNLIAPSLIWSFVMHRVDPPYEELQFLSDPTDPLCATITYSKP